MQFDSPRFPGILAPQGRHKGSGCKNWQNRPSRAADQGWLWWRSRQAKRGSTGLDIPSGPVHRGLPCCHVGCLLFPEGMVTQRGRKEQERQNLATWHAPLVA